MKTKNTPTMVSEKKSLADMSKEELLAFIAQPGTKTEEKVAEKEDDAEDVAYEDIRPDAYIRIMSLCPMILNLSTEQNGGGKVIRFKAFGEVKTVLYSNLVDIIDAHPNFVEGGLFYILNKSVVRKHGLDEIYKNLLTKNQMEAIVFGDSDAAVELYKNANDTQREHINTMLIAKVRDGDGGVDLNFINRISQIGKVDILAQANMAKQYMEESAGK